MLKSIHHFFHTHYHTRYHGVYRHAKQLFVFDIILLTIAVLLLGTTIFFIFWKPSLNDDIDVTISLGGGRIKSGELVHLTIDYTNRSKFRLDKPTLAIHLPAGFVIDRERTPTSSFGADSTFDLPSLKPGAKGRAELYGRFWTIPREPEKILAQLSYTSEHASEPEQKLADFLATLPESVLKDSLVIATSSFPHQNIPFTYSLTNQSDTALEHIILNQNWNQAVTSSSEDLSNFKLLPHQTKTIQGTITTPEKTEDYHLEITSSVVANNHQIIQTKSVQNFFIFYPELTSEVVIPNPPLAVGVRDSLPITISWKNNSAFKVSHLRLKLSFSPNAVNLALTAKENGLKIENGSLIIDSATRTALANGNPGVEDTFPLTLHLASTFQTITEENTSLSIQPSLEAQSEVIKNQTFSQPGKKAVIPLAGELNLSQEIRYFTPEGDQVGRGPLPPKVGETTKYWAFIYLSTSVNSMKDTSISIPLAAGVSFTGKQSITIGSPLRYDATKNTLEWNHPELPAHSRTGLYFELAVTPSPNQIGKTITLLKPLSVNTIDSITKKTIELNSPNLTNVLKSNDRGSGSGAKVVAE